MSDDTLLVNTNRWSMTLGLVVGNDRMMVQQSCSQLYTS
jgi:hypothetical protein